MLLNQDNLSGTTMSPASPWEPITSMVEAVVGWDPRADGTDIIVAVRRSPDGPWFLAGTDTQVSAAVVANLTGRPTPILDTYEPVRARIEAPADDVRTFAPWTAAESWSTPAADRGNRDSA